MRMQIFNIFFRITVYADNDVDIQDITNLKRQIFGIYFNIKFAI